MTALELARIVAGMYVIRTQLKSAANSNAIMYGERVAIVRPHALRGHADALNAFADSLMSLIPDGEVGLGEDDDDTTD